MTREDFKLLEQLEHYHNKYNSRSFIEDDPISVPHRFTGKQDIEIAGLFAAVFAWGNRKTIIRKSLQLLELMDDAPHKFIRDHQPVDRVRFASFVHRTFQYTDLLYFLDFLQHHYRNHSTLEVLFQQSDEGLKEVMINFYHSFFSLGHAPKRTRKHLSSPHKNSACKRINMFLRWMVRRDKAGVDFGIWQQIQPHQLFIPLDVHVGRVARQLNLLKRKQMDWKSVVEVTENLRLLDPADPVRFDYALFGMGLEGRGL